MTAPEQVTLLIHGTFANPDFANKDLPRWWRVTDGGDTETPADRLEQRLAERGLGGTLWRPGDPRDRGMSYEYLVEWTGANTHQARLQAAAELAEAVGNLAAGRVYGEPAGTKLRVNFVAHSHGGNVVLEALDQLPDTVEIGEVCMLGTPLLWKNFAPRLLALLFIALFAVGGFFFLLGLFENPSPEVVRDAAGNFFDATTGEPVSADEVFSPVENIVYSLVATALLLPPLLWLGAWISLAFQRFGRRGGKPAYGPKPAELTEMVGERPPVLFIAIEDEADLMVHLGAAPLDVYKSLVRGNPTLKPDSARSGNVVWRAIYAVLRFIERFMVRPFAYAVVVPIVEILLERFALGFPLRSVLFQNYETVTWGGRPRYGPRQVRVHAVSTSELSRVPVQVPMPTLAGLPPIPPDTAPSQLDQLRIDRLRQTLIEAITGLRSQVRLRHSSYYESEDVLDHVANQLAANTPAIDLRDTVSAASASPPPATPTPAAPAPSTAPAAPAAPAPSTAPAAPAPSSAAAAPASAPAPPAPPAATPAAPAVEESASSVTRF